MLAPVALTQYAELAHRAATLQVLHRDTDKLTGSAAIPSA
jgi:hypothetical protein